MALRWDQIDLDQGLLHVNRLKRENLSTHPLRGPELRALRQLQRESPSSPYLFMSERGWTTATQYLPVPSGTEQVLLPD